MTRPPIRHQASSPGTARPAANAVPLSRRTLLRGAAAAGVAGLAGWSLTACDTGPSARQRDAEALLPHAQAAFRQQRAAEQLAPRNTAFTGALTVVAVQRGEHLVKLREEINRLHSSTAEQIESSTAAPIASVQAFGQEIERSATAAATTSVASSGYVAGLLGSISASCQTLAKVQLA